MTVPPPDSDATTDVVARRAQIAERLYEIALPLAEAVTPADVAAVMVEDVLGVLGARAGYIATRDDDDELLRVVPLGSADGGDTMALPLDAPYPLAFAARTGESLFVCDNADLARGHPTLRRLRADDHSCATVPLCDSDGAIRGALNVTFDAPREIGNAEREMIAALAHLCELAMERASRLQHQQRRRELAERRLLATRALELNDDVVQSLAVATLADELGNADLARQATRDAFEAAKRILAGIVREAQVFERAPTETGDPEGDGSEG